MRISHSVASSEGPLCVGCAKDLALCSMSRKKLGSDSRAADQSRCLGLVEELIYVKSATVMRLY